MSPQPIAQIEKPVHIPLPTSTRARLRAAMASLDRPTPDQSHRLSEARTLLGIFGLRFADLPELLPCPENSLLLPETLPTFSNFRKLLGTYADQIPIADRWPNEFLDRLREGQTPSLSDLRRLGDLKARLRISTDQ